MNLAVIYAAAVTALLGCVLYGYVADVLHDSHVGRTRHASVRTRRIVRLRRVV